MRALAHPTRLRLLAELRIRGPQTVGLLCDVLGEPVGGVSYHLSRLAAHQLVLEVPELARDRRERWWRAAHPRTMLEALPVVDDPERLLASQSLRRAIFRGYFELLDRYLNQEPGFEEEWASNAISSDATLYLTAAQLAELTQDLEDLAARWEVRGTRDQADAHPVVLIYHALRRPH